MEPISRGQYKKPPITEATIAFHLSEPLSERTRERFRTKQRREYPRIEEMRNVQITIGIPGSTVGPQSITGHRLWSENSLTVLILVPTQLSISRVAPYSDWESIHAEAMAAWDALEKLEKLPALRGLSTRFQNRIDVPIPKGGTLDYKEYFNLQVTDIFNECLPPSAFTITLNLSSQDLRFRHSLTFATIAPALIDHASFLLDIDTGTIGPLPLRAEEAFSIFSDMRRQKNRIFESCLKDAARKLFQ